MITPATPYRTDPEKDQSRGWWFARVVRRPSRGLIVFLGLSMLGPPLLRSGPVREALRHGDWPSWVYQAGPALGLDVGTPPELRRARQALRQGEIPAALIGLLTAARRYPADTWPLLDLGLTHLELGDAPTARIPLEQALERRPKDPQTLLAVGAYWLVTATTVEIAGDARQARRAYDLAVDYHQRAVQHAPDDPLALAYLACTLARSGRQAEALEVLARGGATYSLPCLSEGS